MECFLDAKRILKFAKRLNMNVVGIAFHVGIACQEPEAYGRALKHVIDLFDFGKSIGYDFSLIDIGNLNYSCFASPNS